jgi:hypothetical protein
MCQKFLSFKQKIRATSAQTIYYLHIFQCILVHLWQHQPKNDVYKTDGDTEYCIHYLMDDRALIPL